MNVLLSAAVAVVVAFVTSVIGIGGIEAWHRRAIGQELDLADRLPPGAEQAAMRQRAVDRAMLYVDPPLTDKPHRHWLLCIVLLGPPPLVSIWLAYVIHMQGPLAEHGKANETLLDFALIVGVLSGLTLGVGVAVLIYDDVARWRWLRLTLARLDNSSSQVN